MQKPYKSPPNTNLNGDRSSPLPSSAIVALNLRLIPTSSAIATGNRSFLSSSPNTDHIRDRSSLLVSTRSTDFVTVLPE
ncbi:hypothetical protein CMV_015789 [Castanea mollissima]|uniref:Uncharacterized protein n=1 Tax=Castanea mollissima TaxID=60419 RepID=A0A8J4R4Q2_9ROSI|nr:hypothetical protein CMV_015789 [Castanea mollissima]